MRFHSIALLGCLIAASLAVPLPDSVNTSNAKSIKDTCTTFKLAEDKHTLTASCQSPDGSSKESSIDLDKFIGNKDGQFDWSGIDFSKSISISQDETGAPKVNIELIDTVLKADLINLMDHPTPSEIDLAENIKNVDGTLTYTGPTSPSP